MKQIQRILVIRFSSLGDIVLLTPLFRELKKLFPDSQLDFLTSTTFAAICENNPHIEKILALDRSEGMDGLNRMARTIKETDYDLVFDAHQSLRSRLLRKRAFGTFNSFSPRVLKVNKRSFKRNVLLLFKIDLFERPISQREAYCSMLQALAPDEKLDLTSELFPHETDRQKIEELMASTATNGAPLVAIGPGASFEGKCWPKERFLELSQRLLAAHIGVVLLGGTNDAEPQWIMEHADKKPINLSGQLTFLQSAELLKRCKLAISNDSAIVHLSEAMGTPSIVFFGPTVQQFGYGPFLPQSVILEKKMDCRPCSRNGKGKCTNENPRRCLTEIKLSEVVEKVEDILGVELG